MLAALLALSLLPNPLLTPGAVRPLTKDQVCSTKWGTDRRFVTEAMKKHVAAAYGVDWADRRLYEFDHLVPRSLGGADDVLNLWPEPWEEAHRKDRLEVRLGRLVCAGTLSLVAAQQAIRSDWVAADRQFPSR